MSDPSPATSNTSSLTSWSTTPSIYVQSGGLPSSAAAEDAAKGYVSPYPPLPPSCTLSAVQPSTAAVEPNLPPQPTSSATATIPLHDEASGKVRQYTFHIPPLHGPMFQYQSYRKMFDTRAITQAQKQAMIVALNERRVNTIGELRRIERIFATLGSSDLTQPMTAAWMYYVNSNSLLTELRQLTRNYPFSSECLDEGKRRVHQDPASNRSWNYCWLVLAKIHTDGLIVTSAQAQASEPEMWAGQVPSAECVEQLAEAFIQEWNSALQQLLRYWESAPIR